MIFMNTIKNLLNSLLVGKNLYTEEETMKPLEKIKEIDISINRTIRNKYKKGWIKKIRNRPIEEICIHGTGGGQSVVGLIEWILGGERAANYYKGISLFHYLIGRGEKGEKDGLIVEVIDPNYWVYHSTSGSHAEKEIGIELINTSKLNRDPYTEGQYKAIFDLIFDFLMPLYPEINRITSHRYNIWRWNNKWTAQKNDKNCPGNFDWERLSKELKHRGYIFKTDGNLRYEIQKKGQEEIETNKKQLKGTKIRLA